MNTYHVKSAVLLIIFNRPDTTFKVFNEIRKAKPSKLYISADGPRSNNHKDEILCAEAKSITELIDWECKIITNYNQVNKGCKIAVSDAISWFFSNEEQGIILEDDCLPAEGFFIFCDSMLELYRNDTRISLISGSNLNQSDISKSESYHFSRFTAIWGWASWRRVWNKYDRELSNYTEQDVKTFLGDLFNDRFLLDIWVKLFRDLKSNKIDTWDFQFGIMNFFEGTLSIVPNVNLISNIGFREDATHTPDSGNKHANLPTGELNQIYHPKFVLPDSRADHKFLLQEFKLDRWWSKPRKVLSELKNSFSSKD